jgi:hypothetical protein
VRLLTFIGTLSFMVCLTTFGQAAKQVPAFTLAIEITDYDSQGNPTLLGKDIR